MASDAINVDIQHRIAVAGTVAGGLCSNAAFIQNFVASHSFRSEKLAELAVEIADHIIARALTATDASVKEDEVKPTIIGGEQ